MTPPQRTPADLVAMQIGCKADFFRRHRKDQERAQEAWVSLVSKSRQPKADTSFGPVFQPPKVPAALRHLHPLRVIKGLPHMFRAVYVVQHDPVDGIVVSIEWVGDHAEYDRLFGYATS
ncbi:MAG TPA: hypothetical protein VM327_09510 [Candidatus Thermoplasmatota archaeon]|nr:hypothetical protein [Candidatus Thermoplasmatota archaeon]